MRGDGTIDIGHGGPLPSVVMSRLDRIMDLTPEQLELTEFTVLDDGGYAPDEVRVLVRRIAEQLRALHSEGVRGVADSVGAVLDQAVKSGEDIVARANADADAIRTGAEADAVRISDDAAEAAGKAIAAGESSVADAMTAAKEEIDAMMLEADAASRARSTAVISKAQQRLDRLLAAERDVHDRVTAALSDIHESLARAGIEQSRELALTVEDPDTDDPASTASWADDPKVTAIMRESA